MKAYDYKTLLEHKGHSVEIVVYGTDELTYNVALECYDCNEVLLDFDNPDITEENIVLEPAVYP